MRTLEYTLIVKDGWGEYKMETLKTVQFCSAPIITGLSIIDSKESLL